MKQCSRCGQEKAETEYPVFFVKSKQKWYMKTYCDICDKLQQKAKAKKHYWGNRENETQKVKEYYRKNKLKVSERQKTWYKKNRDRFLEKQNLYYQCNIDDRRFQSRMKAYMTKLDVLGYYSQYTFRCVLCGEARDECLSIDHIGGGGSKHRKKLAKIKVYSGESFYRWLQKQEYPKGYRVLCMNCQFTERERIKNDLCG